jgi:hypothetical protein
MQLALATKVSIIGGNNQFEAGFKTNNSDCRQ